jgi:hypothetical protein
MPSVAPGHPEVGDSVRIVLPSEHVLELYREMTLVGPQGNAVLDTTKIAASTPAVRLDRAPPTGKCSSENEPECVGLPSVSKREAAPRSAWMFQWQAGTVCASRRKSRRAIGVLSVHPRSS